MSAVVIAQEHLTDAQAALSAYQRREEHCHTPALLQAAQAAVERAQRVLAQIIREWDGEST